jgi:4-alpha-glucanotransferase
VSGRRAPGRRPRRSVVDAWGIDDGYEDAGGQWHDTPLATRSAIVTAMGGDTRAATGPLGGQPPLVWRLGQPAPVSGPGDLILEDGTSVTIDSALPPNVPLGYHRFQRRRGSIGLIVAPARCHVPADRAWGWSVQLYAARSQRSWGIGDFRDLAMLADWARGLGAGFVLLNPLSAATPTSPQQPSPYLPSSRRFKNLLYLAIEDIPGAGKLGPELDRLAERGRALNTDRRIDREAVLKAKLTALGRLWAHADPSAEFAVYRADGGKNLEQFATFCALAEQYGGTWRLWPPELRHPASKAVQYFAGERADRVAFYAWVQWLLDNQFARASRIVPGIQDLPIGFDPDGADAWIWQDLLAPDVEVGAPPDVFNALGQRWGLPPFVPYRLADAGYVPFIETIRQVVRHAGGLRIDHVMGLFRLFWIPRGMSAVDGAFVRYPADALLGIVALESVRAGAFVVGEDLGTVEDGVRERLAATGILSYRLLWFETAHPRQYPDQALAAVTTHDLPTIHGLWSGADARLQRRLGLRPNKREFSVIRRRVNAMAGLSHTARIERVIDRLHGLLGRASSRLLSATLEDALAVTERPNMPGADDSRPNWCLALPQPIETLASNRLALAIAAGLSRRRARRVGESDRRQQPRVTSGRRSPPARG